MVNINSWFPLQLENLENVKAISGQGKSLGILNIPEELGISTKITGKVKEF